MVLVTIRIINLIITLRKLQLCPFTLDHRMKIQFNIMVNVLRNLE